MKTSLEEEINETRAVLDAAWSKLPGSLKGPTQFLGRQYVGCGATVGVMPHCDLHCSACYLGKISKQSEPQPIAEIKSQITLLRRWLGPAGNLQITDGEVTLRRERELIEIISHARQIGLVPMVMTNGERIRQRPELLENMMMKGGLTEICFHVDTTMKGRTGHYATTTTEEELNGLRAEFADIIRRARGKTGLKLEAASTVTVTQSNLEAIPGIVQWFLTNADAFKMVAFLPAASIGCTDSALQGVTSELLWSHIEKGAGDAQFMEGEGWLGHPSCGRFVQGLSVRRKNGREFVPLYLKSEKRDMYFLNSLLDRIGGNSFRLDSKKESISRAARIARRNLFFLIRHGLPYLWRLGKRTHSLDLRYFCIVSHHFMNGSELNSALGLERRSVCAFQVPFNGELIPMCTFNASGVRDEMYRPVPNLREKQATTQ